MPDQVMPSRLELRLQSEISHAPTEVEADCKRAELAAYRARLGRLDEARGELVELRRKYLSRAVASTSAWFNFAEALIVHSGTMSIVSMDKFHRSYVLSIAFNLPRLRALNAAWIAHISYLKMDVQRMVSNLREARQWSLPEEHSVRARSDLVLAQAYHFSGRFDLSLPWYRAARQHATIDGDETMLSALNHNMAWLRAQRLRINGFLANGVPDDFELAEASAKSSENYDLLVGAKSLPALVPILRAQILTAKGEYSVALDLFESNLEASLGEGMNRLHADLRADKAWCYVKLGEYEKALVEAKIAESNISVDDQFDDVAMAHCRLSQVYSLVGKPDKSAFHMRSASKAWNGYTTVRDSILSLLDHPMDI
jgi:tetratricopeptide (TPR) repeat protein